MTSFTLKSDDDFKNRQKKVFEQLGILETTRSHGETKEYNVEKMDMEEDEKDTVQSRAYWDAKRQDRNIDKTVERNNTRNNMKQFKGKESIFKKPQHPAPKNYINRIPDFKKNPHKWTKYSLEDVAEVTDDSNKKSAMSFLKELANRKRLETDESEKLEELPTKIVFKKHTLKNLKKDTSTLQEEEKSFQNSKLVMPEYVIGQKVKKEKKQKTSKPQKGKELKLDHLAYEDDE